MKPASIFATLVLSATPLLISACAQQANQGATPNAGVPAARGAMTQGSKVDRATMCSVYARMTPEEKRAMLEAHHGNVTPEMMQRHEERTRERCAADAVRR